MRPSRLSRPRASRIDRLMSATDQPPPAPAPPERRGLRLQFVPRKFPRSYVPPAGAARLTLFARAIDWLLPWSLAHYPGKARGIVDALGGRWSRSTLLTYMKREPVSVAAVVAVADLIRARMASGQALIAELEAYADANRDRARRKREAGLMRIDPTTGLSGREKAGKRRGVKPG
jgi:hypothetical protein